MKNTSNFSFLNEEFTILCHLCQSAEYHLYTDATISAFKLRQFGEKLTEILYKIHYMEFPHQYGLHNRIRELKYENILPDQIATLLTRVRIKGNLGVHQGKASHNDAISSLLASFSISKWFVSTYGEESYPELSAQKFHKPENLDARHALKVLEEEFELRETEYQNKIAELTQLSANQQQDYKSKGEEKANALYYSERETRQLFIDPQLKAAGWEVDTLTLDYKSNKTLPQKGKNMAISEWPVTGGYADYALFIGLELYGVIEAKKYNTDISTNLSQSKRYAENIKPIVPLVILGEWRGYKVPYLFSTNGRNYLKQIETKSGIWFLDVRKVRNNARVLQGWYSPEGLKKLHLQDINSADNKLKNQSPDFLSDPSGLNLRDYQMTAISKVEESLLQFPNTRRLLLAMATGTGKTRTIIGLVYRLIQTNRFRRILFLVDRRLLASQAFDAFKDNKVADLNTFGEIYKVSGLKDVLPELETRLHFATVQSIVKRLFYSENPEQLPVDAYDCIIVDEAHRGYLLDKEQDEEELEFKDQKDYVSKYRMVLEYFDSHAIGLTATPALHTTDIFGRPVYSYSYREAVIDGWLIDHEPPIKIKTELSENGITFKKGEKPEVYNPETNEIIELDALEDELNFEIDGFNKSVLSPSFNRTVITELVNHLDPEGEEKTLIFAARDDHADLIVKMLKEEFAEIGADVHDEAIIKLTGIVDKPKTQLKKFKNEIYPNIVVTVDLLTTGIDVPTICNLVFMRRVRSRILYEQMVGRATRLCDDINKEIFRIYDAVRLYEALEDYTSMKPVVVNPKTTMTQLAEELPQIRSTERIQKQLDQIVAKLHRKKPYITEDRDTKIEHTSEGLDFLNFINKIQNLTPEEAQSELPQYIPTLRYIDKIKRSIKPTYLSNHPDSLIVAEQGYGKYQRPEDYIESFQKYIEENKNKITGLTLVCTKPSDLDRKSLKELRLQLDDEGFNSYLLNKAYKAAKNEDIAADIISYIRSHAIGSSLISHEERIKNAVDRIRNQQEWNKIQSKWLDRFEKQLIAESILQKEDLDKSPFSDAGGYRRLNKVFNNELDDLITKININLYNQSA